MDQIMRAFWDKSLKVNRVQHLVVSDSKHIFLKGEREEIGFQKKDLDHRTCGNRKMVTRVIAFDEDSGVFYAELWPRDELLDLVGFLGRAWAEKNSHPMMGCPSELCVPARVLEDQHLREQVEFVSKLASVPITRAAGGFGPTTVACREYERQISSTCAMYDGGVLRLIHLSAQELSYLACSNAIIAFREHWKDAKPMDKHLFATFDGLYDPPGGWRGGDFEKIVKS